MASFYSDQHRVIQDAFDTRRLADAIRDKIIRSALAPRDMKFVAESDFFFLSTVDHNGFPTVSYKGGAPGFVRILDEGTVAFPVYDGNGMFYSMGNIIDQAKVGMLFIDFEHPRRLRLHGTAEVSAEDPLLGDYTEALLIVRVALETVFTNCSRYIHKYRRVESSEFVPKPDTQTPIPEWKRVDWMQESLPAKDRDQVAKSGDTITEAEYRKKYWDGLE